MYSKPELVETVNYLIQVSTEWSLMRTLKQRERQAGDSQKRPQFPKRVVTSYESFTLQSLHLSHSCPNWVLNAGHLLLQAKECVDCMCLFMHLFRSYFLFQVYTSVTFLSMMPQEISFFCLSSTMPSPISHVDLKFSLTSFSRQHENFKMNSS